MRLATARLMARSAREIPHYYVTSTIDVAPMTAWLAAHNAALPVRQRVLPIAVLLRAVCKAATAVPDLNGHWIDDAFVPGDGVHLGVATATRGGGLVTPAVRDAGALDVDALMAALADLIRRARKGSLRSSEIAPGTLTVSSLADGGPDALFGVIYPPQVALVGVGGITERPWAVNGMLTVRPTVTITLAADHRATDGRTGAAFLAAIAGSLAHPEEL
jgi:pyruvate dehydrogenase E2 component (dihydrolipoamide acetyltransferase)